MQLKQKEFKNTNLSKPKEKETETQKSNRYAYLDIAKGISILMIMNVHFPIDSRLFINGVTFHIVTFFVISGILIFLKNECKLSYKEILIKKIKSIGFPYFTMSTCFIVIWTTYAFFMAQNPIQTLLEYMYYSVSLLGMGTLWFLPTLFFGELIFIYLYKMLGVKKVQFVIPILVLLTTLLSYATTKIGLTGYIRISMSTVLTSNILIVLFRSIIASGFIGLGYLIGYITSNNIFLKINRSVYCVSAILMLFINYKFSLTTFGNDLHFARINTPIAYLISSVLGTIAILILSYGIENLIFFRNAFSLLGRNSLIIMTTHLEYKVVSISYFITNNIFNISHIENRIFSGVLMFIIIIPIELIIANIINNSKLKYLYKFPHRSKQISTIEKVIS